VAEIMNALTVIRGIRINPSSKEDIAIKIIWV
jgi:hypothetical protein